MLQIIADNAVAALTGPAVIGVASLLAAFLPRPAEGTKLAAAFKLLDIVAANYLAARNAPVSK